jgi:predicted nucleic acid-binding protein
MATRLRAVVDTNVVFEGVTRSEGAPARIIEAWLHGRFGACVSDSVAYEYVDVLSNRLSPRRWNLVGAIVRGLLHRAELVRIHFRWRPASPDPGDDHVIECAMNAGAAVVTSNRRHFEAAVNDLGLTVWSPEAFAARLEAQDIEEPDDLQSAEGERR